MTKKSILPIILLCLLVGITMVLFKSYNTIQTLDEKISSSASEIINQYQRRADLIPNLVSTVKGYAQHEQTLLTELTATRAQIGQIQINADNFEDEQKIKQFQQAQQQLQTTLSRLIAVSENYPELKANTLYQDLLIQLEGTENRIAVARGRYIHAVQEYNIYTRKFPGAFTAKVFGYSTKPNFIVDNISTLSEPPKVEFN